MKREILKHHYLYTLLNLQETGTDRHNRKLCKGKAKDAIREEFGTVSRLCRQYNLPRTKIQEFLDDRTKRLNPKYRQGLKEALTTGLLPDDWPAIRSAFKAAVDARAGGIGYEGVAKTLKLEPYQIPNLLRPDYKATESEAFSSLYSFAKGYVKTGKNEH